MTEPAGFLGAPRQWALDFAVATGIGLLLGVLGPFGSFNGGPLEYRLVYWVAIMWIGLVMLSLVLRLTLRAAERIDLPIWFALSAGTAIGAAPLSLAAALFSARFWPENHGHLSPLLQTYGETLAISEPCAFAYYFLVRRRLPPARIQPAAPGPVATPPAASRLLDRLPPRLGRELLCLQMEDHYVRAHTDRGSDLILTPLKAALAELGDIEGLQVHRSWWVARRAVAGSVVSGRSHALRLINGLEVPVSRACVAKVRAKGWL